MQQCATGKRGFEGKVFAMLCKFIDTAEHQAPSLKIRILARRALNACCDLVRVDKCFYAPLARQDLAVRRCFSCTIRAGDDEKIRQASRSRARGIRL